MSRADDLKTIQARYQALRQSNPMQAARYFQEHYGLLVEASQVAVGESVGLTTESTRVQKLEAYLQLRREGREVEAASMLNANRGDIERAAEENPALIRK